jgi:hypothetical protein
VKYVLGLLAATAWSVPLAAQVDYRNLDDDRPIRIEDAYPVERFAFELILPSFAAFERGGAGHYGFVPELSFGILPGAALGVKLPVAGTWGEASDRFGPAGVRAFFFVNLTTETVSLPGLALRLDATAPLGGELAGDGGAASIKALATRSFGRQRIHLNAAWGFITPEIPGAVEPVPEWWAGAAVDRTVFRNSTLLLAGVSAVAGEDDAGTRWEGSLGLRRQVTPTLVLDAGIAGRLAGHGERFAVTLGFTHAFAIAGLMPGVAQ